MMTGAPIPTESEDQTVFVEAVQRSLNPSWRFTHIPNGGKRDKRTGAMLRREGVSRGVPDFMFIGPRWQYGGMVFIELKRRKGGRTTPEQEEWARHLTWCGFTYLKTNDTREAYNTLRDLGIVRGQVMV